MFERKDSSLAEIRSVLPRPPIAASAIMTPSSAVPCVSTPQSSIRVPEQFKRVARYFSGDEKALGDTLRHRRLVTSPLWENCGLRTLYYATRDDMLKEVADDNYERVGGSTYVATG